MFTGIVEALGTVTNLKSEGQNLHITIAASFTPELKIDQSISHDGICLTVVSIDSETEYTVTAINETLMKSNLKNLKEGTKVNLERCMKLGDRLDGHLVQGHVDQTGAVSKISEEDGSWRFKIEYDSSATGNLTVEKGSITVNGVSLTVVDSGRDSFSVAIIPYTFENTNFRDLEKGDVVNLEFDVIGKYVSKIAELNLKAAQ